MTQKTEERPLFQAFLVQAKTSGFSVVKPELENRDKQRFRLKPPNAPRVLETANQVILAKELDGYTIRVLTSYDPRTGEFTEVGRFWILIVTPDPKKGKKILLQRYFHRRGNFLDKGIQMMQFLVDRLENRPADSDGNLMRLVERKLKIGQTDLYTWMGSGKAKRERKSFFLEYPSGFDVLVDTWCARRSYYETVLRKRRGVKQRARKIRKTWKVKRKKA